MITDRPRRLCDHTPPIDLHSVCSRGEVNKLLKVFSAGRPWRAYAKFESREVRSTGALSQVTVGNSFGRENGRSKLEEECWQHLYACQQHFRGESRDRI